MALERNVRSSDNGGQLPIAEQYQLIMLAEPLHNINNVSYLAFAQSILQRYSL